MQQVSSAYVQSVVPDRHHFYSSLLRNQLYCPKITEKIMTTKFMKGIIGYEVYWVPFCANIRILNCADPPTKNEIAMELVTVMRNHGNPEGDAELEASFQRTATEIRRAPPNTTWMLNVLSTLYPQHRYFQKDFVKPTRVQSSTGQAVGMINNPGDFFSNLPISSKRKKHGRGIVFQDRASMD